MRVFDFYIPPTKFQGGMEYVFYTILQTQDFILKQSKSNGGQKYSFQNLTQNIATDFDVSNIYVLQTSYSSDVEVNRSNIKVTVDFKKIQNCGF